MIPFHKLQIFTVKPYDRDIGNAVTQTFGHFRTTPHAQAKCHSEPCTSRSKQKTF
jgi:hypothetical protein